MDTKKNLDEQVKEKLKNNRFYVVGSLILAFVLAVATFTEGVSKIKNLFTPPKCIVLLNNQSEYYLNLINSNTTILTFDDVKLIDEFIQNINSCTDIIEDKDFIEKLSGIKVGIINKLEKSINQETVLANKGIIDNENRKLIIYSIIIIEKLCFRIGNCSKDEISNLNTIKKSFSNEKK